MATKLQSPDCDLKLIFSPHNHPESKILRTQSVLLIRDSGVSGCDEIIFVEKAMLNTEGTHAKFARFSFR